MAETIAWSYEDELREAQKELQKLHAEVAEQQQVLDYRQVRIEELQKEAKHWKGQCKEQVRRKRVGQRRWKERAAELKAEIERLKGVESALRHLLSFDSTIPDIEYTRRCGCDYCKAIEGARAVLEEGNGQG